MDTKHIRTESLGGSTLVARIRCDDPRLRPCRTVQGRYELSMPDGASVGPEAAPYHLTFLEGAVWDIGRIASRLELQQAHDAFELFTR